LTKVKGNKKYFITILVLVFSLFINVNITLAQSVTDTANSIPKIFIDTILTPNDSLLSINDTTFSSIVDSAFFNKLDSTFNKNKPNSTVIQPKPEKKSVIEDIIKSKSSDTMIVDLINKKIYLINNCVIDYGDGIHLESGYAEIDMKSMVLFAKGIIGASGQLEQNPKLKDGEQEFRAKTIKYNFNTGKGYITDVITQQGEGYLHGETVKKFDDNVTNLVGGAYTTCDLDHPHFQFRFNKGKVIPDDKIVTGVTYLEIEDIPMPLGVPFAMFPLKDDINTTGFVMPSYGNSTERGFFLQDGGYFWNINDYLTLKLLGDIYSRGSWAVKPTLKYSKRYKYSGSFALSFANTKTGIRGTSGYSSSNNFKIAWSHKQDAKARPNSNFSANVNFVTSGFNKTNPSNTTDYLKNTFESSIAYQTSFANNKLNLSLNMGHSQNTLNRSMTFTLPSFSLSSSKIFPFKRKKQIGGQRWYEKINFSYTMVGKNEITSVDTLLFKENILDKMKNGVKHTIPVKFNTKIFKFIIWDITANYTERWYSKYLDIDYQHDTIYNNGDTIVPQLNINELYAFKTARDFNVSTSLSTTLYGMMQFKKGYLKAVRHVLTPSVSFKYTPDFGTPFWNYYDYYLDKNYDSVKYSIFDGINSNDYNSLYGTPTDGRSGLVSMSVGNSLEIKVRSKNDTVTGTKKIKLIESLSLSTGYDIAKDSVNWSPLSISGRTSIVTGLNINYSTRLSPYATNAKGQSINKFIWETEKRLFVPPTQTWSVGFSYSLNNNTFKNKKGTNKPTDEQNLIENTENYFDWDNQWNMRIGFTYNYVINNTKIADNEYEKKFTQIGTVDLSGLVYITPKWKINYDLKYDIINNDFTYANLSVYRDLHCWEMSFNWVPFGYQKQWSFTINVKSSMLSSLKYEKNKQDF
jgi:hypothetical protein